MACSILSVIVPTYNERQNLEKLLGLLTLALSGADWEMVIVDDDSPDGTAQAAKKLAQVNPRVRCLHRIGRRGLASACIEGMCSSSAKYVAVLDGDMQHEQHDEALLPKMLDCLEHQEPAVDLVIGSRYLTSTNVAGWNPHRQFISRFATHMGQRVARCQVTDPMSGFFMMRRTSFDEAVPHLSGIGFKILLDILASAPRRLQSVELPYEFRQRNAGESKLDSMAALEFGLLLADKTVGRIVPVRFVSYVAVGALGLLWHLAILQIGLHGLHLSFGIAQSVATLCAMVFNFLLNNTFTYRDRSLRGTRLLKGIGLFVLVCAVGAFANVGISNHLFNLGTPWWLSGIIGSGISAVWNYGVSSFLVWGGARRS